MDDVQLFGRVSIDPEQLADLLREEGVFLQAEQIIAIARSEGASYWPRRGSIGELYKRTIVILTDHGIKIFVHRRFRPYMITLARSWSWMEIDHISCKYGAMIFYSGGDQLRVLVKRKHFVDFYELVVRIRRDFPGWRFIL